MKKKIISIFLFFLICLPTYSSERVVYLDLEKIMQESIAGKSIIAQIKKSVNPQYLNLKKEKKRLLKMKKN